MLSSFLKLPVEDSTSHAGHALPTIDKKVKDEYQDQSVEARSANANKAKKSERIAGASPIIKPQKIASPGKKKRDNEVAGNGHGPNLITNKLRNSNNPFGENNPEDRPTTKHVIIEAVDTDSQSSETSLMENVFQANTTNQTITTAAVNDTTPKMQGEIILAAENEDAKDRHASKVSIYFTAMPTFGYQRIESKTYDNIYIESIKRISAFSTERLGVRLEVGAEIPISNKIKVFSGIVYFQRKQTIDYTVAQVDTTFIRPGPNGEYIVETELKKVNKSFEYELKNIGLQIGINYRLSKGKFLQSLGTGFEFHYALNKLSEQRDQVLTNDPSAYVFYNLYYRLQYPSEGRLKAVFQPTLNYSFYISQNLNAPFYVKPYGLGLNLGFTYNF